MKKIILLLFISALVALVCAGCAKTPPNGDILRADGFTIGSNELHTVVDTETEEFTFDGKFSFQPGITHRLYKDIDGNEEIKTLRVSLKIGGNNFYLVASNNDDVLKSYKVVIYRKIDNNY